jgi:hypothetical protein
MPVPLPVPFCSCYSLLPLKKVREKGEQQEQKGTGTNVKKHGTYIVIPGGRTEGIFNSLLLLEATGYEQ